MENLFIKNISSDELLKELSFQATRSSGKGGQNVNKVSTKITLIFDIEKSYVFNNVEKETLLRRLQTRINAKGELKLSVSRERYQSVNKSIAIKQFLSLINKALKPDAIRIKTKPGRASHEKRLFEKANLSAKKKTRSKKPTIEE